MRTTSWNATLIPLKSITDDGKICYENVYRVFDKVLYINNVPSEILPINDFYLDIEVYKELIKGKRVRAKHAFEFGENFIFGPTTEIWSLL